MSEKKRGTETKERRTVPEGGTVRIRLNGKEREVPEGLSVLGLLEHLEVEPGTVAVEHDREVLERDRYDAVPVEEGDQVELVHFVGGG